MSISFVNNNYVLVSNIPTSISISASGISANDLLISLISFPIGIASAMNSVSSIPSGWNTLANGIYPNPISAFDQYQIIQYLYYKVATSADNTPTNYTWGLNLYNSVGFNGAANILSVYRGVNTTNPIGNSATSLIPNSNNPSIPAAAVNITNTKSWITITYTGRLGSDTFNQPSGYSSRGTTSVLPFQLADSNAIVNTGIVSPGNWTATPGTYDCVAAITLEIKSADGSVISNFTRYDNSMYRGIYRGSLRGL